MSAAPDQEVTATPFDDGVLYDVVCGELDYGVEFYLDLARRAGGPVLDVACGTGRVMLPMLREGLDVEGVDLFAPMLARLKEKAAAVGLEACVHQSAMADLQLDRRFALIMIPFNAFVHNLTTDDQLATLTRCREHLQPGGLLAFDGFFPGSALVTAVDGKREFEGEVAHPESGLPVRMWDTRTFDRVAQLMTSNCETEFLDAAGNVTETRRSTTVLRWIYRNEMELLLRLAGFARWRISGSFDRRPLLYETDGMIVEAWAA